MNIESLSNIGVDVYIWDGRGGGGGSERKDVRVFDVDAEEVEVIVREGPEASPELKP